MKSNLLDSEKHLSAEQLNSNFASPVVNPLGNAASLSQVRGSSKRGMMWVMMSGLIVVFLSGMLMTPMALFGAAGKVKSAIGPTPENALAADQELARALADNDTVGIVRMLDKDWVVIATTGGLGEGPSIFPNGIRSGYLTRKTYSLSEPRVRLYGNIALVTTKVETSGMFQGKPFEVTERQTDVWRWKDGEWKCILTHETNMPKAG
jgi:ketosteroid isomerase-like protein